MIEQKPLREVQSEQQPLRNAWVQQPLREVQAKQLPVDDTWEKAVISNWDCLERLWFDQDDYELQTDLAEVLESTTRRKRELYQRLTEIFRLNTLSFVCIAMAAMFIEDMNVSPLVWTAFLAAFGTTVAMVACGVKMLRYDREWRSAQKRRERCEHDENRNLERIDTVEQRRQALRAEAPERFDQLLRQLSS